MYTVYILKSLKDLRTYTGYSDNVMERLRQHNSGMVDATRDRRPLKIFYTEDVANLAEAKKRELYWKSGAGRRKLSKLFKERNSPASPSNLGGRGSPK